MRFKRELENMCDVAFVPKGYEYWFDKLLAYCLNIFKYEGLPATLPSKEIESNLILTGHCVIFKDKKKQWVTCLTAPSGFDKYYNPTFSSYSQPVIGSGTVTFGDSSCIMYNCDLQNSVLGMDVDGSLNGFIGRFARLLSDIESTISNLLVNMRDTFIPVADNSNVKNSIKNFIRKRILGQRAIVTDSSIVPNLKSIDIGSSTTTEKIYDLMIARDKILECFYREIGIRFYQPKKAQVNEEEMTANNNMLLISLDDLLEERQKGLEWFNRISGLNVTVRINEKILVKEENNEREVTEDEEIL